MFTTIDLDTAAGVLCLIIAFATFIVEIVTSSKRWTFLTLPRYVRNGLFLTGGAMLYRGVNFLNIAGRDAPSMRGHVNAEGLFASACLAYTMAALASYVLTRRVSATEAAAASVLAESDQL